MIASVCLMVSLLRGEQHWDSPKNISGSLGYILATLGVLVLAIRSYMADLKALSKISKFFYNQENDLPISVKSTDEEDKRQDC